MNTQTQVEISRARRHLSVMRFIGCSFIVGAAAAFIAGLVQVL